MTPLANPRFDSEAARRRLEGFYSVKALDGFGSFGRAEIAAAGALVDYVALTQQGGAAYLAPPQRILPGSVITADVPADALALGRGRQVIKEGWAAEFRKTRGKKEKQT